MGMVRVKLHHLIGNHAKKNCRGPDVPKIDVFQGGVQKGLAKSAWRNLENMIFDICRLFLEAAGSGSMKTFVCRVDFGRFGRYFAVR